MDPFYNKFIIDNKENEDSSRSSLVQHKCNIILIWKLKPSLITSQDLDDHTDVMYGVQIIQKCLDQDFPIWVISPTSWQFQLLGGVIGNFGGRCKILSIKNVFWHMLPTKNIRSYAKNLY